MVRVNKFFCLDLKTAGLVIGSVDIILLTIPFLSLFFSNQIIDYAILLLLEIFASVAVVLGTQKNKHLLLLPFLILNGIFVVLLAVMTPFAVIGVIIILVIGAGPDTPKFWRMPGSFHDYATELETTVGGLRIMLMFAFLALLVAFRVYCYLAIYSLYHRLRQGDPQELRGAFDTVKFC